MTESAQSNIFNAKDDTKTVQNAKPTLWQLLWQDNHADLIRVMLLNLLSAIVSIGVIGFINQVFLQTDDSKTIGIAHTVLGFDGSSIGIWGLALVFLALVILQLITTFVSQYALTKLGHRFVYRLRRTLVKQILDTPHAKVEQVGSAKLLASLSDDVGSITTAFVRLPQLIQGVVTCFFALIYLAWLSVPLTIVAVIWLGFAITIGGIIINKVYDTIKAFRDVQDRLYKDYETAIHGHKELMLNRHRSQQFYEQQFDQHADTYRQKIIPHHVKAGLLTNLISPYLKPFDFKGFYFF